MTLAQEVDTLLDHAGGLEAYRRDDAWRADVTEHFEFNVQRMVRMCREATVPIVLCNPVVNLRDCPPFKFTASESLSGDARQAFESRWQAAGSPELTLEEKIAELRDLTQLDPRHAGVQFHLAKCLEAAGEDAAARRHYLLAKEEDLCPLRILEPMRRKLARIARAERAPWVDVEQAFAKRSPLQAPGDEWLVDHVHPTIEGHQLIAAQLLQELQRQAWVAQASNQEAYDSARRQAFRDHLATLDETYFARGQQRLEGLRRWTQGRASQALTPQGPSP